MYVHTTYIKLQPEYYSANVDIIYALYSIEGCRVLGRYEVPAISEIVLFSHRFNFFVLIPSYPKVSTSQVVNDSLVTNTRPQD